MVNVVAFALGLAGTAAMAAAPSLEGPLEVVPIEVYSGPKATSINPPHYPRGAQRRNEEGWVQLNFMVDSAGKAYEISAMDSSGSSEFIGAAISAVKKWQFEPAHLDGVPLDAGASYKIAFELEGLGAGASSTFVRAYKKLAKAITKEDRAVAEVQLQKLKVRNLYEEAYFNVARFLYAEKWGTEVEQLRALRQAVAYEEDAKYLPAPVFTWVLQRLVTLQLAQGEHPGALASTRLLLGTRRKLPKKQRALIQQLQNDLLAFRDSSSSFSRLGRVGKNNYYWLPLWRDQFTVEVLSGEVAELKLRCSKGYVFFRYDPTLAYNAPNSDKSCKLQVVGNPGSKLRITQN